MARGDGPLRMRRERDTLAGRPKWRRKGGSKRADNREELVERLALTRKRGFA